MKHTAHIVDRRFVSIAVATALLVAVSMCVLPGAPVWSLAGFVAVAAVAQTVYIRRCGGATPTGAYVLLAVSALLAVGIIANVHYYTAVSGETDAAPVLRNTDALRNWNDAMSILGVGTGESAASTFGMYSAVIGAVLSVTGVSITAALIVSMTMTLMSVICVGVTAWRLTADRRVSALSMASCAAVCYFLASGTLLIKDAWVIAAFALAATGLASAAKGDSRRMIVPLIVSAVMLLLSRPNMLGAIIVGVVICVSAARISERRYRVYLSATAVVLVCATLWVIAGHCEITPEAKGVIGLGQQNHWVRYDAPNQMAYYNIIGDYTSLAAWQKVLLMPVSAAVQYLIPFPWNWCRDVVFGPTSLYAHIAYPGYLFGITVLYYLVRRRRRQPDRALLLLTLWGVLCWLIPCYLFGGTISRYGLVAVPLLSPAVATVIARPDKKLYRWTGWCAALLVVVLIVCYILQTRQMP